MIFLDQEKIDQFFKSVANGFLRTPEEVLLFFAILAAVRIDSSIAAIEIGIRIGTAGRDPIVQCGAADGNACTLDRPEKAGDQWKCRSPGIRRPDPFFGEQCSGFSGRDGGASLFQEPIRNLCLFLYDCERNPAGGDPSAFGGDHTISMP